MFEKFVYRRTRKRTISLTLREEPRRRDTSDMTRRIRRVSKTSRSSCKPKVLLVFLIKGNLYIAEKRRFKAWRGKKLEERWKSTTPAILGTTKSSDGSHTPASHVAHCSSSSMGACPLVLATYPCHSATQSVYKMCYLCGPASASSSSRYVQSSRAGGFRGPNQDPDRGHLSTASCQYSYCDRRLNRLL